MKIAVIHDRIELADEIADIAREAGPRNCEVVISHDLLSARDLLKAKLFDLVIVDLTLPVKIGKNEPTLRNAELLLEEIFEGTEIKRPGDVLGISKDVDAISLVATTIGRHLMGCIAEDLDGLWRKAVAEKVRYVASATLSRQTVANASYDHDLVIITALDKEAAPYAELFELRQHPTFRNAKAFSFQSQDGRMRRGALFSVGNSGQGPTGSATQALLTQLRPRLALMTGFCGGVKKRASFGDLMVFKTVFAWDYGKWEDMKNVEGVKPKFRPRPSPVAAEEEGVARLVRDLKAANYQPDAATMTRVSQASGGKLTGWALKPTAAASGSAVVTSLDVLNQIVDLDENIWAIEMESWAFYHACRNTPRPSPGLPLHEGGGGLLQRHEEQQAP